MRIENTHLFIAAFSIVASPLAFVEDTVDLAANAADRPRLVLQITFD